MNLCCVSVFRLLADVWPRKGVVVVVRALGGVPRIFSRFWEHYKVSTLIETSTLKFFDFASAKWASQSPPISRVGLLLC